MGQLGSNSMCCARTAVLQEGTKSRSKCQCGLSAAINAFVKENKGESTKKHRKIRLGSVQNRAQSAPGRPKNPPNGAPDQPRDNQERFRSVEEPRKKGPREAKRRPGAPTSRPREVLEPSKKAPGLSKIGPTGPKTSF